MTNMQILHKALLIAKNNGWKGGYQYNAQSGSISSDAMEGHCFETIYDHNFAKALWGDQLEPNGYWEGIGHHTPGSPNGPSEYDMDFDQALLPAYLVHLQQMVISEDPIAYLALFI